MSINLSHTHGDSKYNQQKDVNSQKSKKSKKDLQRVPSRRNVRAKVVRNTSSIYAQPKISSSSKSANIVNQVINTIFRATIVGVGIGTLFGTFLASRDLTKPLFPEIDLTFLAKILPQTQESNTKKVAIPVEKMQEESTKKNLAATKVNFTKEDAKLKKKFATLTAKYPQHKVSAFFVDLDNGVYVNSDGIKPFPAASTIKIPVLVAFLEDVDAGKIYLDEQLTLTKSSQVSGSGGMQYAGLNHKYSAIHTATEMIISSDNAATEMIIERLGGRDKLNKRFEKWGLESTVINNPLPDLKGTNTTSARDLAILLAKVNQGQLISLRSRDRLMDIMTRTKTRTLLPQGIESGAMIAHKTGDIGTVLGDAGIIDMPTGKRYVGVVFTARPYNDVSARTLIQDISRSAYQHFKWYIPRSNQKTKK